MKISGDWIDTDATQSVFHALEAGGHTALFVGGCVRNSLLGMPVGDIDIATDAHPQTVIDLTQAVGLRAIPTGIEHGTITVVADGIAHEITTFRADIDTDGRRAKVAFSDSIEEDAARRDFTMNALYADKNGKVVDPLGGIQDLNARLVRFINDAELRIKEDYLRSLRFFRFTAWYGDPEGGLDADALAAIAANLDGLDGLSRERVGSELVKLMMAPDPAPAVAAMHHSGVLAHLLPGTDANALTRLVHLEQTAGTDIDAFRRLAALGVRDGKLLRLSKAQSTYLTTLGLLIGDMTKPAHAGYKHGSKIAQDAVLIRAAVFEHPVNPQDLIAAADGANQVFPVFAGDLMPELAGAELGAALKQLEARWVASDFTLGKDDLLRGLDG